jgi:predicted patatin/cPLA2 family phospholipase
MSIPLSLDKTALIPEGGGLQGVYAAGVLRFFLGYKDAANVWNAIKHYIGS